MTDWQTFKRHLPIRFKGLLVAGVIPEHWCGYVSRRWRGGPRFGQLRLGHRQCEQGHNDPRDFPTRHHARRLKGFDDHITIRSVSRRATSCRFFKKLI